MCHVSCIVFGSKNLTREEVRGKRVIEIGSCDVNGGLRPIIESWEPADYVGVDIKEGPGVDAICNAESLLERLDKASFDIVISTELLEHVRDWRKTVSNIKNVCKPGGVILVTTRSYGFGYHACPYDFWRYDLDDMENIFSDCDILALEKDYQSPGVFVKAKKPNGFFEIDLLNYELYSIVVNTRVSKITDKDLRSFYFKSLLFRDKIRNFLFRLMCSI